MTTTMAETAFGNPLGWSECVSDPPSVSVWVDNVRLADGSTAGETELDPVVLTDLKIVWGRDNSLDQPNPSTCNFQMLDILGGQTFLNVLHMGAWVNIRADAVIYGDPLIAALPAAPLGVAYLGNAVRTGYDIVPVKGSAAMTLTLPPAAKSPDPSSWNGIPRTLEAQQWSASLDITVDDALGTGAAYSNVTIRPIYYDNPDGTGASVGPALAIVRGIGITQVRETFYPPPGVWVGLQVTVSPSSVKWSNLPAVTTRPDQYLDTYSDSYNETYGALVSGGSTGLIWEDLGSTPTWDDLDQVTVYATETSLLSPSAGTSIQAQVFSGRITDMKASFDPESGGTVVEVIAEDHLAELANRYVGSTPWPLESLGVRFARIINALGAVYLGGMIQFELPGSIALLSTTWRDVDNQPSLTLMRELATSGGAVLWTATDLVEGPMLFVEDPNQRTPMNLLTMVSGVVKIIVAPVRDDVTVISACDLLLEPVTWEQTVEDDATEVSVSWWDQAGSPGATVNESGVIPPMQTEAAVRNANMERLTGRRRISVSTQLADSDEALALAGTILERCQTPSWRVRGLVWETNPVEQLSSSQLSLLMRILDGRTRIGMPILLTDLPEWSPLSPGFSDVPLYLEGLELTNSRGYWRFALLTSNAWAQGKAAVKWSDVPSDWSWSEFDPTVVWYSLSGVGIS